MIVSYIFIVYINIYVDLKVHKTRKEQWCCNCSPHHLDVCAQGSFQLNLKLKYIVCVKSLLAKTLTQ